MARMYTTSSGTGDLDLVAIAGDAPYSGSNSVEYSIHTPLEEYETGVASVVNSRLVGRAVVTSSNGDALISVPQPPSGVLVYLTAAVAAADTSDGAGLVDADYGDITVSGDGTAMAINPGAVVIEGINATGTASASTFLRGDGAWATPAGSGDVTKVGTPGNNQVGVWTGDATIEGGSTLTFDGSTDTLAIGASGTLAFGVVGILDDADGVTTLKNIDAIDAATEATIVAALELDDLGAADAAAVNAGTATDVGVTPDALAGSYAGTKSFVIEVFPAGTAVTTGDGKAYFPVPAALNGMDVVTINARVITAGTTNATLVQVYNVTDAVDICSSGPSIASGSTAVASGTVNASNDALATDDLLRVDVDTASTTPPQGLFVTVEARLP